MYSSIFKKLIFLKKNYLEFWYGPPVIKQVDYLKQIESHMFMQLIEFTSVEMAWLQFWKNTTLWIRIQTSDEMTLCIINRCLWQA